MRIKNKSSQLMFLEVERQIYKEEAHWGILNNYNYYLSFQLVKMNRFYQSPVTKRPGCVQGLLVTQKSQHLPKLFIRVFANNINQFGDFIKM